MNKKQKRLARCLAIQLLYSSEVSDDYSSKKIVSSFFRRKDIDLDEVIYSKDEIDYATKLVDYALKYIEDIDKLIQEKLVNWEMKRLAVMDKIILRMSISEMLYMEGIPPKVSMAEGIEIAKQFSTADSSRFINGVLDAIYNDHKDNIDKKS
jgi:N utilization substance protein B